MAETDWGSRSRAELIEEGRGRGWKCTGWSKPQLVEKLRLSDEMEAYKAERSLDALEADEARVTSVSDAVAQAVSGPAGDAPEAEDPPEGPGGPQIETGEPEEGGSELPDRATGSRRQLSGWCSHVPLWSSSHLRCASGRSSVACECECHEDGFERPPAPEGAQLNRFYSGE